MMSGDHECKPQTGGEQVTKVLWVLFMAVCSLVAVWQIHGLYAEFSSAPHFVTNIFLQKESFTEFPNITVCNMNRVNMTKARELNMSKAAIEFLFLSQMGMYDVTSAVFDPSAMGARPQVLQEQREAWEEFWPTTGLSDVGDLFMLLGHDCQGTLGLCKFGQHFDCCSRATPILNSEFGLCWTLSMPPSGQHGQMSTQDFPGMTHGLRMHLNPGLEYYDTSKRPVFYNNYLEHGPVVSPSFDPRAFWVLTRTSLTPGTHVAIEMENFIYRNTKPEIAIYDRGCKEDSKMEHINAFPSYSNCVADCMQAMARNMCSCYMVSDVKDKSVPICSPTDIMDCFYPALFSELERRAKKGEEFTCCLTCIEPCADEKTVKMRTSLSIQYPAEPFLLTFKEYVEGMYNNTIDIPLEHMKQWVVADIYFTMRGYTVVESTIKVEIFTLVGNVGGQLGLWLGASILSFIQVIGFIVDWIRCCMKKKKNIKPDPRDIYM